MKLVEPRIEVLTITCKLNFEFQLVSSNRQVTYRTCGADAWTSPCTVGSPLRQFSITNHLAGLLSKDSFVHLAHLGGGAQKQRGQARCHEARRPMRLSGTQWKAASS